MNIAVSMKNGGVLIMQLLDVAAEAAERAPEFLDDIVSAEIRQWPQDQQEQVASWLPIDIEDIPSERTFRDAWRLRDGVLAVDMPTAREIHRDNLRAARLPILEALDIAYQRADEKLDAVAKASVAARKQELRDVTAAPEIEAAATPEELKGVWPAILKG